MLKAGVYPAAVTPFDPKGRVDLGSLARLLAWFEAAGCQGAVLAGTNGEGPSLSAVEKRDLLRDSLPVKGQLDLVLGIATPSLDEALWLCKQAAAYGAAAVLIMAPSYFRSAGEAGIERWFERVLDESPTPALIYNFPKMTGFTVEPEMLGRLLRHPNACGAKDSSGENSNLAAYRRVVSERQSLFVGDETLLIQALESGWSGTISGAANVVPHWLSAIVREWISSDTRESSEAKFSILEPVLRSIRSEPQPATHKKLLARWKILDRPEPRLPLQEANDEAVERLANLLRESLGMTSDNLGL